MITGKISLIKNKEKEIAFPVTSAEAVYMPDGKTTVNEQLDNIEHKIEVFPSDFGAIGDGMNDDTIYLQEALNYCQNNNAKLISQQNKTYKITNKLSITKNINISGWKSELNADLTTMNN